MPVPSAQRRIQFLTHLPTDREQLGTNIVKSGGGGKRGRSINMAKSEAQFVVTCNLVRLACWRSAMNVTN